MPPYVFDYIICIQALIFKHMYITGDYMLASSEIFIELKSPTQVSDLYSLMQRIF